MKIIGKVMVFANLKYSLEPIAKTPMVLVWF
jgi:hypothetical protein